VVGSLNEQDMKRKISDILIELLMWIGIAIVIAGFVALGIALGLAAKG